MDRDINQLAAERLAQILVAAATDANQRTLFAVSAELGLTHLGGLPVAEFHEAARKREVERLLASGADHNMPQVSIMKQLWDCLQAPKPLEPDEK